MDPTQPLADQDRLPARQDRLGSDLRSRKASAFLALALLLVGTALVVGVSWTKGHRLRTCLDSTLTRMRAFQDLVPEGISGSGKLDFLEADTQLRGLQDDLACLRRQVDDFLPLAPLLGWLPEVGPDIAAAPLLLEMAQAMVDGGVLVFDGLSPLLEQMQPVDQLASGSKDRSLDLPQAVAALAAARPSLTAAELELERAAELRAMLETEALSPRLGRLLDLTDRYLPLLRAGVSAAQFAPQLLGTQETRTYLILAQNEDERRPTGGWISGMGLLTIENGRITEVTFQDSWTVDNLQVPHDVPPDSMFRVLWAGIWLFRDANWSPDFPTSARVAESILQRDQGITVDGVIAVNQQALQLLVAAMQPLTIASSPEAVTGANVLAFIRDSWAEPEQGLTLAEDLQEWTLHRKDFMADLVEAMRVRVETQPENLNLTSVASALWRGLQERHILVYLHDVEAAELLASRHWDGAVLETEGDYLQVVDANVGFNKVDPNVTRTIDFHVDLSDPELARAGVAVHYQNNSQRAVVKCRQEMEKLPSYEARVHGCYWDYVRFFVPEGSWLLTAEREPLPSGSLLNRKRFAPPGDAGPDTGPTEAGKIPYGVFFVLEPGAQRTVRLGWGLPARVIRQEAGTWNYQLLVQKQSGTPAIPMRVRVSLPPDSVLVDADPKPFSVQADAVILDLLLGTDQSIKIVFKDSSLGEP